MKSKDLPRLDPMVERLLYLTRRSGRMQELLRRAQNDARIQAAMAKDTASQHAVDLRYEKEEASRAKIIAKDREEEHALICQLRAIWNAPMHGDVVDPQDVVDRAMGRLLREYFDKEIPF